jgi:hypothetical protein
MDYWRYGCSGGELISFCIMPKNNASQSYRIYYDKPIEVGQYYKARMDADCQFYIQQHLQTE